MLSKDLKTFVFACCLLSIFSRCGTYMSTFDQQAYRQVTELKVDALDLMDLATEPYTTHRPAVRQLQNRVDKAIEYDKHRLNNKFTVQMWAVLNDPERNLLGGFLVKWRKEGKCGAVYIAEKKAQVARSFDQIAELESKKIKKID